MHIKEVSVTLDICSYLEAGNIDLGRLFDMVNRYNVGNNRGTTVLVHLVTPQWIDRNRAKLTIECPRRFETGEVCLVPAEMHG